MYLCWYDKGPYTMPGMVYNIEYRIQHNIHRYTDTQRRKYKTQNTNKHNNKNKQTQKLNVNNEPTTENPM